MSIPFATSAASPVVPPPRTNGTPSGYRNIRVLTTCALHFRLVAYAGLSACSLNEFILKVLHLATPIDLATGLPVSAATLETAPGHRPRQDPQGDPGDALGLGAAQSAKESAPGHLPGHGSLDIPGLAARPGASPSPGASVGSRLDQVVDPALSGPLPTLDLAELPPAQDHDGAEPEGQAHA
jgi:hypothetical protein